MRVFFDDQIFVEQAQGGISRYFTELARALGAGGLGVHVFGGISRNVYLASLRGQPGVTARTYTRRDRLRINKSIAQLSRLLRRLHFAAARRQASDWIYHATNYDVDPWIARRARATFLTVFDMIAEKLCDPASRARSLERKRHGVALAHGLLSISEQTARDFLDWFPARSASLTVTPLAASLSPGPLPAQMAARKHAPYLLFVGNRDGYKNGRAVLEAFAQVAPRHPQLRLVCFGGEPLRGDDLALLEQAGVRSRTDTVQGDDEMLAAFYANATALLYPSRYEGFGLPVLEAMHLGCPVITTRCGSLPEVGGDAAVYVDPDDVISLAANTERMIREPDWGAACRDAGRRQSQRFSWASTAAKTRAAYEKLRRSPRP